MCGKKSKKKNVCRSKRAVLDWLFDIAGGGDALTKRERKKLKIGQPQDTGHSSQETIFP